jgi:natural product precursor
MVNGPAAAGTSTRRTGMNKKLTLSRETLRSLDEQDLSMVVGGAHHVNSKWNGKGRGNSGRGSWSHGAMKRGCRYRH